MADLYILRDITTKDTLFVSRRTDGYIPEIVDTPNAEWVRIVQDAPLAYNPVTQKLVGTVTESGSNPIVLTRGYQIVALTAPELATIADTAARLAKRTLVAQAIPALRQWAIDADAVTVTSGNAVATLQLTLDRLSVFFNRFADLLEAQRIDQ